MTLAPGPTRAQGPISTGDARGDRREQGAGGQRSARVNLRFPLDHDPPVGNENAGMNEGGVRDRHLGGADRDPVSDPRQHRDPVRSKLSLYAVSEEGDERVGLEHQPQCLCGAVEAGPELVALLPVGGCDSGVGHDRVQERRPAASRILGTWRAALLAPDGPEPGGDVCCSTAI